jgi:hypothetical protein
MDLVDLRATSIFLGDLEFTELEHLAGKIGSRAVFLGSGAAWSFAKQTLRLIVKLIL